MFAIIVNILLLFNIFYVTDSVRRIQGGALVKAHKSYMVYLVKAPKSDKVYDEWLCGGALVSLSFILTSAACLEDVEYIYAIAGYSKYVPDSEIETDQCTKKHKKKIVYTCVSKNHEFSHDALEKWSYIDIALAKVESPYDPNDETFKTLCTYIPTVIPINFEPRFHEPGTDAIVLGWGHKERWRKPDDKKIYNQNFLNYASVKITENELCKKEYVNFTGMSDIIDQYMLCTIDTGLLDDKGTIVYDPNVPQEKKRNGCSAEIQVLDIHDILADDDNPLVEDKTRRGCLRSNQKANDSATGIVKRTVFNTTRRSSGICQNDHGGPLVTWVGAYEVLTGVASVYRVDGQSGNCSGPYLYTATTCVSSFIDCILSDNKTRRSDCDSSPLARGYDIVEKYIDWSDDHPIGTVENVTLSTLDGNGTSATAGQTTQATNGRPAIVGKFWSKFRKHGF